MECVLGKGNRPWGFVVGAGGPGMLHFQSKENPNSEPKKAPALWDGSYPYPMLAPGTWIITFKPRSDKKFESVSPPCVRIPTKPAGTFRQDFARVGTGEVAVYGTVTDAAGEAVTASQKVAFNEFDLMTQPDGSFATALPPGEYEVKVNGEVVDGLKINRRAATTLSLPEPKPKAVGIAAAKVKE